MEAGHALIGGRVWFTFPGSDADPFVFTRVSKWLAKLDFITSVFFFYMLQKAVCLNEIHNNKLA